LDALDLEIEEHQRRSRILKDESERNKQKAADLAEEDMEEAAKRRLAVYLLCKQLRTKEEAVMADLDAARLQMVMQTEHPTSQTIEKVNKALKESATERDKSAQAFNRMSYITQVNVEQTSSELEDYGIKQKNINDEFAKLKAKTVQPSPKIKEQIISESELPEVPAEQVGKPQTADSEKVPEKD
jgi:crotonobetainyl-CoA:carnitine CoA-transferase CaiB-like acyl-CoA transferase